ncbi:MAG: ABC transporter ATP-binding protein [Akkermansiaceae bacterium]|nr:ABC transporter ATP-binding protein [Armatimonadota bacterium]
MTLLHALQGIGPALSLLLLKIVIDTVTRFDPATGDVRATMSSLGLIIVAFFFTEIVMDSAETLGGFVMSGLEDKVEGSLKRDILVKVSGFNDISLFENPDLLNLVHLAQSGVTKIQSLASKLGNVTVGVFAFVPVFILSASIAWWIPVLIFLTSLPSILFQGRFEEQTWNLVETQAEMVRDKRVQEEMLSGEPFAKDIRLFRLQGFFLRRWDHLYQSAYREMQALRKKGTAVVLAWSLLSGLGIATAYVYLIAGTLTRQHSVGDLAVFTGLIFQVRSILFILLWNTSNLFALCLETRPVFTLLETMPSIAGGEGTADAADTFETNSAKKAADIEFRNVSFRYPNSPVESLSRVNLHILAGETVAIVGENGAGKTTLAKLACRLYDPTGGEILWDGKPLATLDITSLRSRITWVGQDFARFVATLRQNVAFGWLPSLDDNEKIKDMLGSVGLTSLAERGGDGLETLIGAGLEKGTNLSGGQWQRLAVARALMRKEEARLMILDEPTSALDPRNEYEILSQLQTLARSCTGIVITHRLSLARACDRIVVFDKGAIVESGTHAELMRREGLYQEMFVRQASSYLDPEMDLHNSNRIEDENGMEDGPQDDPV